MKTKHLLLSFLAVAALVSACRKDKEPGEEGQDQVQAVTVTEFLAAPESDTQVYELVGTIEGNINTTYGFFDLKDETGSVYVYGLTATPLGYGTKNDHSYSSLGLNPGDRIRIRGYRGSYGDKIEMMYAWFVSRARVPSPKAAPMATRPSTFPTTARRRMSSTASASSISATRSSRRARPTSGPATTWSSAAS